MYKCPDCGKQNGDKEACDHGSSRQFVEMFERLFHGNTRSETKVDIRAETGIPQLIAALESWLDKSRDNECSEYMAERLSAAARTMRTKASRRKNENKEKT